MTYVYYDDSHIRNYKDGVDVIELFPGSHDEVRSFKYFLKAGTILKPEKYATESVLYLFGGKGEVILTDDEKTRVVNTVAFYAPDYDRTNYTIQAVTDAEFVMVCANMDSDDIEKRGGACLHLPWFRTEAQCDRYDQDCKTPRTISRTVLFGEFDRLGRLTAGICEASDCAGTIEKGHAEVHQWNYCLNDANYHMTVGSGAEAVTYKRKAGDFDFIPAGPDHTLYAGVGEKVHYVWVEFNVNKRGK